MKMIEGFKVKIGTLCISSVLRDITNHMLGVNYGEEIYYGLGCGLFFAYTMSNEVVGLGGFTDLILDNLRDSLTLTKVETYALMMWCLIRLDLVSMQDFPFWYQVFISILRKIWPWTQKLQRN